MLEDMVSVMHKTPDGQAKMWEHMSQIFDKLVKDSSGLLAQERMGEIAESLSDLHDVQIGGHWVYEKETSLALFKFTTGIFGKDGKVTKEQWHEQW